MKNEQEPTVDGLTQFLIKAKRDGYASGETKIVKEEDGSYSTRFEEGDFKFHDNWFGGEPFLGREVVWYKNKPYWGMVYFGADYSGDEAAIPTLRKALAKMPDEFPVRGPKELDDGKYKYENRWEGDLNDFSGEENIYSVIDLGFEPQLKRRYSASYKGGLINK